MTAARHKTLDVDPGIHLRPATDAEVILSRCRTEIRRIRVEIAELRHAEAAIFEAALPLSRGWIPAAGAILVLRDEGVLGLVLPHMVDDEPTDTGRAA